MRRDKILAIPMTDEELAWVYLDAASNQQSANAFVRGLLLPYRIPGESIAQMASTVRPQSNRVANTLAAAVRHARKAGEYGQRD